MNKELRNISDNIIKAAISAVLPDEAVKRTLENKEFTGRVFLIAIGKAAWQMAKTAKDCLDETIDSGVVITKYGHIKGDIKGIKCIEAGHPILDENSIKGTKEALKAIEGLTSNDTVLFLVSGGGSALFESPLISLEELQDITNQLLGCGADIVEINTIRKRLSAVKGGKFAKLCEPAKVYAIILSDIIGDPLDMIASGPACPDSSTCKDARHIIEKYNIKISDEVGKLLDIETPKSLDNVTTTINGSVKGLCLAASKECAKYGYKPIILTDELSCEAKEAGSFLASIAKTHINDNEKLAYIAGGETVVTITGKGKGGRNQELALSACVSIANLNNVALFSIGSDGTDGPTDAAGGYVDSDSYKELKDKGIDVYEVLKQNDAYNALDKIGGLIKTGPTGTNVNDVTVLLIG